MIITKRVQGHDIKIELVRIKDYPRYSLYQLYKLENGKRIPLYKECYTDLQINDIVLRDYKILEEVIV